MANKLFNVNTNESDGAEVNVSKAKKRSSKKKTTKKKK